MSQTDFAAVLTGDLVHSRSHSARDIDRAFDVLSETAADIAADQDGPATITRYRGDGWQVYLQDGGAALRAALRLYAALAAQEDLPDTRVGIGLGAAHVPDRQDLNRATGAAFEAAGAVLDAMSGRRRIDIQDLGTTDRGIGVIVELLDHQASQWTPLQAATLVHSLRWAAPTQEEVAQTFGVSRQAIQGRLAAVGIDPLRAALHHFQANIHAAWSAT